MGDIIRLQKYIAMCGAASRRGAEEQILAGRVKVNDQVVREMGVKVEIGADKVYLDGEELKITTKKYYIMLNKPAGYVTTVKDQFERPTVTDLIDLKARVVPVGRLDYETEGLLILTNDGDFNYRVTHPKFETSKKYFVEINGGISIKGLNMLRRGVVIDGFKTSPADVEMIDAVKGKTTFHITIHEGRNRQVRKMFEAVGCKVTYLKRVQIGNVELGNVPVGHWRHLTTHEINSLMNL